MSYNVVSQLLYIQRNPKLTEDMITVSIQEQQDIDIAALQIISVLDFRKTQAINSPPPPDQQTKARIYGGIISELLRLGPDDGSGLQSSRTTISYHSLTYNNKDIMLFVKGEQLHITVADIDKPIVIDVSTPFSDIANGIIMLCDSLPTEIDYALTSGALTFEQLRVANVNRMQVTHKKSNDWILAQWMTALVGEIGEAANILKKVDRGDFSLEEAREYLGKELADVQSYLDILAYKLKLDLGQITIEKFNEVSDRLKCNIYLEDNPEYPNE